MHHARANPVSLCLICNMQWAHPYLTLAAETEPPPPSPLAWEHNISTGKGNHQDIVLVRKLWWADGCSTWSQWLSKTMWMETRRYERLFNIEWHFPYSMASAGRETQSLITADKLKEAKAHHSLPVEQKKKRGTVASSKPKEQWFCSFVQSQWLPTVRERCQGVRTC